MKRMMKRTIALLTLFVLLVGMVYVPIEANAANEFYGDYTDVAKIYDYGSCPSMQGLAVGSQMMYTIKINSNDTKAFISMTDKDTGTTTKLYNSDAGSYYFDYLGHANDMDVWGIDGYSNLFVTSTNEGSNAIVRLKRVGNNLTKVASYSVSYNGSPTCVTALAVKSVSDGVITFITKLGMNLYTGSVSTSATSADIKLTKLCTISKSRVYIKGSYLDLSSFVNQGFGYYQDHLFVPISGDDSWLNRSVIMVFDLRNASGTIFPTEAVVFRTTSSYYGALFEIESCDVCPSDGKLYFNTNRRRTDSDTNHDGVSSYDGYTFSVVPLDAPTSAPKFTMRYNANGGTGTMADTVVTYGQSTALRSNTFTRTGYTFKGWTAYRTSQKQWRYTNADGSIDGWYAEGSQPEGCTKYIYKNETKVSATTSVPDDVVQLYAQWTAKTYTITFKDADGTVLKSSKVAYGKTPTAPANPTKASDSEYSYTFAGWSPAIKKVTGTATYTATYTATALTPAPTEPPVTAPPVTEPPVTEPPVTEPPVTEPPVTEPPVTEPAPTEPTAAHEFYGDYTDASKVYDYGSCPSMQGLAVGSQMLYTVKINSDDTKAFIAMTDKDTGTTTKLYNSDAGSYYFDYLGHANDMDVWGIDGYSNLFVTSTNEGSNAIVRLKRVGNNLTKVASYSVSYNGSPTCVTALAVKSVSDGVITFITKLGMDLYTGSVSTSATSADIKLTKLCTISKSRVYIKGSYLSLSKFVNQGFGYYQDHLFVPVSGDDSQLNRSVIMVFDLRNASGTIFPTEAVVFRTTSSYYGALFEIESCDICPSDGKLYFNTNRRRTDSDTNHDGVSSYDGYTFSVVPLNTPTSAPKFTVRYNANGGTGTMADTVVTYGQSTAISANTFTRTGYTFKGWTAYRTAKNQWYYTNADGSSRGWYAEGSQPDGYTKYIYKNSTKVSATTSVDGDVVQLYAQWTAKSYTVTFKDADGTVLQSSNVAYGKTPTPPADPTKASDSEYSYTFAGWTPAIKTVTGTATYTATYTATALPPAPAAAHEFYGDYTDVSKIYDYGSCPSMQGLAVGSQMLYTVKINSNDTQAFISMTDKDTGTTTKLYNSDAGSYYFDYLGHANDMDVWGIDGYSNLFVTSTNEGSNAIVRLKRVGNNLTKVASYSVSHNGSPTCVTALAVKSVSDGVITFITKLGMDLYTGSVSTSATSADIKLTKLCTINKGRVYIKGSYLSLSKFVNQGFGYYQDHLFVPVSGDDSQLNRSVIMVFDLRNASGTIFPTEAVVFRTTSSYYGALFEIESCDICPSDGKLYFNTNRRRTDSDTNHDGVSSYDDYTFSVVPLNTPTSAPKFTVRYNANGGTGTMADTVVTYGQSTAISANTFTRTGYTFKGWTIYRTAKNQWYYTNADGSDRGWYAEGSQPDGYTKYICKNKSKVSTTTSVDGDVVQLHAQWTRKTYTITFKDADGTVLQSSKVAYGKTPTPPANPTKASDGQYSYTFAGWTPAIKTVTGTATYTATYKATALT